MAYNITYVANSTSVLVFTQRVNEILMRDSLGWLFLGIIYVIVFISTIFSTNSAGKAFIVASFIGWVMAMLLVAVGLLGDLAIFLTLIGAAAGVAIAVWSSMR